MFNVPVPCLVMPSYVLGYNANLLAIQNVPKLPFLPKQSTRVGRVMTTTIWSFTCWGLETKESHDQFDLSANEINPKGTLQPKQIEWRCNWRPVSVGEANNFRRRTGDVGRLLRQTGILSKCRKCATRDILNGCWRPSRLWNLIIFRHFADVAEVVSRGIGVSKDASLIINTLQHLNWKPLLMNAK